MYPCTLGYHKVGKIKLVYTFNETNWPLHEQIKSIDDGYIIFVETYNCGDRAIFGQLVSKYLILYCQSEAIIIDGKIRDSASIIKDKWPIWCRGFTPIGCFNTAPDEEVDLLWKEKHFYKYDGAIAVCDDCGVVVIPKEFINESFMVKLREIKKQEDIWFDRLDHYKESTFDIVCKKKYLEDPVYMFRMKNLSEGDLN